MLTRLTVLGEPDVRWRQLDPETLPDPRGDAKQEVAGAAARVDHAGAVGDLAGEALVEARQDRIEEGAVEGAVVEAAARRSGHGCGMTRMPRSGAAILGSGDNDRLVRHTHGGGTQVASSFRVE